MSLLSNINPENIDWGDVVFDIEAANRMADTVYDGVRYLKANDVSDTNSDSSFSTDENE